MSTNRGQVGGFLGAPRPRITRLPFNACAQDSSAGRAGAGGRRARRRQSAVEVGDNGRATWTHREGPPGSLWGSQRRPHPAPDDLLARRAWRGTIPRPWGSRRARPKCGGDGKRRRRHFRAAAMRPRVRPRPTEDDDGPAPALPIGRDVDVAAVRDQMSRGIAPMSADEYLLRVRWVHGDEMRLSQAAGAREERDESILTAGERRLEAASLPGVLVAPSPAALSSFSTSSSSSSSTSTRVRHASSLGAVCCDGT